MYLLSHCLLASVIPRFSAVAPVPAMFGGAGMARWPIGSPACRIPGTDRILEPLLARAACNSFPLLCSLDFCSALRMRTQRSIIRILRSLSGDKARGSRCPSAKGCLPLVTARPFSSSRRAQRLPLFSLFYEDVLLLSNTQSTRTGEGETCFQARVRRS